MPTMGVEYHEQNPTKYPFEKTALLSTDTSNTSFTRMLGQKDRNLLTVLMLLGARVSPDLELIRDELVLELTPKQRIISILCAAILEDSRVFTGQKCQMFAGVVENKWLPVRTSTFTEKYRLVQILEAADPKASLWPELCQCANLQAWVENGDCEAFVGSLLAQCNIEYSMFESFIQINPAILCHSLACSMLAAPGPARVDTLYGVLFSPDMLKAVVDEMQNAAIDVASPMTLEVTNNADLVTGLKLLVGFVSVFFGAGLVLGHNMTPSV